MAQPNINSNPDKKIITVELPGIKDKERARKLLQTTANLQFWEVYTLKDNNYANGWQKAIDVFNAKYGNVKDTSVLKDTATIKDTSVQIEPVLKNDTPKTKDGLAEGLKNSDTNTNDTLGQTKPEVAATQAS